MALAVEIYGTKRVRGESSLATARTIAERHRSRLNELGGIIDRLERRCGEISLEGDRAFKRGHHSKSGQLLEELRRHEEALRIHKEERRRLTGEINAARGGNPFSHRLSQIERQRERDEWQKEAAYAAGIPKRYLDKLKWVQHPDGVFDIYFGGIGHPDGLGHGHFVITVGRNNQFSALKYARMPELVLNTFRRIVRERVSSKPRCKVILDTMYLGLARENGRATVFHVRPKGSTLGWEFNVLPTGEITSECWRQKVCV